MSRSRWVVLLGPPLILIMAAGLVDAVAGKPAPAGVRTGIGAPPLAACPSGAAGDSGQATIGAWWRTSAAMEPGGTLAGWTLIAGLGDRRLRLDLPPASTVSGPERGRVIVTEDDGTRSVIRILDIARGCQTTIDAGQAVARGAIAEATGNDVLVHLLARGTRADLGLWRIARDGRRRPVLGPAEAATLRAAGIETVWATNVASARDGRLAVQSCGPESCLTRILERRSGRVVTIAGPQGDLIGFAGDRLVTRAACPGLPCGVLAWTGSGSSDVLAGEALGAAVTGEGVVIIATPAAGAAANAIAIDVTTGHRRELGPLARTTVPLPAGSRDAGLETGPDAIALLGPSGPPTALEVLP